MGIPISFATKTVERVRPTEVDDRGNVHRDYTNPESVIPIEGCIVQPMTGGENDENRSAVMRQLSIQLPAGADVSEFDHIRYKGRDYEIVGDDQDWESPTGALDHVNLLVQRWEG